MAQGAAAPLVPPSAAHAKIFLVDFSSSEYINVNWALNSRASSQGYSANSLGDADPARMRERKRNAPIETHTRYRTAHKQ